MCEYRAVESEEYILTKPLPLFLVRDMEKGKYLYFWEKRMNREDRCLKQLKRLGLTDYFCKRDRKAAESSLSLKYYTLFAGHCLLGDEVKGRIKSLGLPESVLPLLRQKATVVQGIENGICQRCGGHNLAKRSCHFDSSKECEYCLDCHTMGECRSCSEVWFFPHIKMSQEEQTKKSIVFQPEFPLTKPQKDASRELVDFYRGREKRCLLWAVCGAGKTEVCYEVLQQVIEEGGRVLFAIPRRDVVQELAVRLKGVFPELDIKVLYGGSTDREVGQLTVATTHQVMRFYQMFDLVILDEADAFPYRGSEMLRYAVGRAAGESKIIYLTATPEKELLSLKQIRIPARHHGYKLPEPEVYRCRFTKGILPQQVMTILDEFLRKGEQAFIFLPTIRLVQTYGRYLESRLGKDKVLYSWSSDVDRDKKKESFAKGKVNFLLSTTILERGVTVSNVNVLVLLADMNKIYNTASLVQMAGRVGRKSNRGRAMFFASKMSEEMQEAIKQIKDFNREAWLKGYLYRENEQTMSCHRR